MLKVKSCIMWKNCINCNRNWNEGTDSGTETQVLLVEFAQGSHKNPVGISKTKVLGCSISQKHLLLFISTDSLISLSLITLQSAFEMRLLQKQLAGQAGRKPVLKIPYRSQAQKCLEHRELPVVLDPGEGKFLANDCAEPAKTGFQRSQPINGVLLQKWYLKKETPVPGIKCIHFHTKHKHRALRLTRDSLRQKHGWGHSQCTGDISLQLSDWR